MATKYIVDMDIDNKISRVVYYSPEDLAHGLMYERVKQLLLNHPLGGMYSDINDVMELYNAKLLLDNCTPDSWKQEEVDVAIKVSKSIPGVLCRAFTERKASGLYALYQEVDDAYHRSLWRAISDFKLTRLFLAIQLGELLDNEPMAIRDVLKHKNLVNYYSGTVRQTLLKIEWAAELLLTKYVDDDHLAHKEELYLPICLTVKDKEDIIERYL